jgi:uncharacterized protein DUF3386/uncharacterized protein DUF4198
MHRFVLSLAFLATAALPARAHFIWIVPDGDKAKVVFSDSLEPDPNVPLDKIATMSLWIRGGDGQLSKVSWTKTAGSLNLATTGEGDRILGGACRYGVITRGGKTFLLNYYPKYIPSGAKHAKAWDKLPLEILPGEAGHFTVLFNGKPAANAEVVILAAGDKKIDPLTTNGDGSFTVKTATPGVYGIRARHIEATPGTFEGEKYEEVRHYATLVFTANKAGAQSEVREAAALALNRPDADPAATKLLSDARAARANWDRFAGFSADAEVNFDGKVFKSKVEVDATGKVKFEDLDKSTEGWAKRTLASIVGHRIGGAGSLETPCAFADKDERHPLGRLINVLSDELHSSYRIRDRQIMVVNRTQGESRFSITMQENRTNAENRFLPASFVVHYWDAKTGELTRTEANLQTWTRVGAYDLPVTARVITATKELSTRSLTLSNHRLAQTAAK